MVALFETRRQKRKIKASFHFKNHFYLDLNFFKEAGSLIVFLRGRSNNKIQKFLSMQVSYSSGAKELKV